VNVYVQVNVSNAAKEIAWCLGFLDSLSLALPVEKDRASSLALDWRKCFSSHRVSWSQSLGLWVRLKAKIEELFYTNIMEII